MATTTPNFGWPVPTSTDLVKDGATAIEGLGDAIDASLLDLKGGTTNQVLAKNSNTDMDFKWVADASGIPATIVDAKGDLIAGTAADTVARLAVGNNGETLVADSSTTTGLRYQEPLNLNPVLNSGFDIFQRGTASTAIGSGTFLADRWQAVRVGFAAGGSQSRQVTGDTTNLPNIQYCLRVQRDSGNTSTANLIVGQNVESVNSIPYAGKTITFSFYARAGANYSSASSVLTTNVASGTGTDQNLITAGTLSGIDSTITNHTLTTTWQRFTVTKNVASTATQLAFQFSNLPVGTAGANDYFEVTGVMINVGSVAYPFRRTTGTIQGELAACQRYFQIIAEGNSAYVFNGNNWYAFDVRGVYTFPVQMRTAPTLVGTTGTNYYRVQYNTTTDDLNEIKMASATVRNCLLLNDTQAAVTAGTPATVLTNNAAASVAISAEL